MRTAEIRKKLFKKIIEFLYFFTENVLQNAGNGMFEIIDLIIFGGLIAPRPPSLIERLWLSNFLPVRTQNLPFRPCFAVGFRKIFVRIIGDYL